MKYTITIQAESDEEFARVIALLHPEKVETDDRLESLALPLRAEQSLLGEGILRVSELVRCSDNDLLKLPNFGRKSLNDVKDALAVRGLALQKRMAAS